MSIEIHPGGELDKTPADTQSVFNHYYLLFDFFISLLYLRNQTIDGGDDGKDKKTDYHSEDED